MLVEAKCPCCGASVDAYPLEKLCAILTPMGGEIIHILSKRAGEYVDTDEIGAWVYRRDRNGGPDNIRGAVFSAIDQNRRRLAAMGWAIQGRIGGHNGGYMLVKLPTQEAQP